jgi:hypothetical protein
MIFSFGKQKPLLTWFVVVCTLLGANSADTAEPAAVPRVVHGSVNGARCFTVSFVNAGPSQPNSWSLAVVRQSLRTSETEDQDRFRLVYGTSGFVLAPPALFRWRIAHDCFWSCDGQVGTDSPVKDTGHRIPLNELDLRDCKTEKQFERFESLYPGRPGNDSRSRMVHDWTILPPYAFFGQQPPRERKNQGVAGYSKYEAVLDDAWYDFLPLTENQCQVMIIFRGEVMIHRGTGSRANEGDRKGLWEVKWTDDPVEKVKVDFAEPCWVFGDDTRYLFVTNSGQLHVATKGSDSKHKSEPAWRRGTQPIVAVITDVDTNRYFAFTKPARDVKLDGKPMYFELGTDPKPEIYDRDAILRDAKDGPATITALARFLVEQKKISLKK